MPNAYQTAILAETGLIHYWELDERSGTTATDSGGARNATFGGTPTFDPTDGVWLGQPGIPAGGTAVKFGGTGTRSTGASTSSFSFGGTGVSMEAWVYVATDPGSIGVIGSHDNSVGSFFAANFYLDASRVPTFFCNDGSNHTIAANGAISINTWQHIVGVAPTSGTMKLYVDGVAQTATASLGTPTGIGTTELFGIGADAGAGNKAKFTIDELALYNVGLSAGIVLTHYNAGIGSGGNNAPLMMGF